MPEKSALERALENDQLTSYTESSVMINGRRYRKVEVEGEDYYLSFKSQANPTPELLCNRPGGHLNEHLVEGTLKVRRRKLIYFKLLQNSCSIENGRARQSVELIPQIGIFLPESEGDLIKNKRIGINLVNPLSLQFMGEF